MRKAENLVVGNTYYDTKKDNKEAFILREKTPERLRFEAVEEVCTYLKDDDGLIPFWASSTFYEED